MFFARRAQKSTSCGFSVTPLSTDITAVLSIGWAVPKDLCDLSVVHKLLFPPTFQVIRAAASRSETLRTTVAFSAPFAAVAYPDVTLIP
jgi:hypothetical protein